VTALYDAELRATGYRTTQFTLLQVLRLSGEITQGGLAEMLALDSTTLTRNIAPLIREGLIAARPGTDRRERLLQLTVKGLREITGNARRGG
jgi:DNA-binding MarR family transcriptional regulator